MNLPAVSTLKEPVKTADAARRGHPHRILVVDDDTSMLRFTTRALKRAGFTVETANDGAAAWDALQLGCFDLLITDHIMPGIRGFELITRLRAFMMTLPVIMVSGTMPRLELDRHPSVRVDARLYKPFTVTELLKNVKSLLHGRRDDGSPGVESPLSPEGLSLFPNRPSHP